MTTAKSALSWRSWRERIGQRSPVAVRETGEDTVGSTTSRAQPASRSSATVGLNNTAIKRGSAVHGEYGLAGIANVIGWCERRVNGTPPLPSGSLLHYEHGSNQS